MLSSECKSGFSALSLFPTDTSANIPTGATATEVLGTMEPPFTSQAANWFAPSGRFALNGSVLPKGWKGGVAATQYVERKGNLAQLNAPWTVFFTNIPPTGLTNAVRDAAGTNGTQFYRVRAVR